MVIEQPTRRGLITGIGAFFCAAPAIVRATSIMPVKAFAPAPARTVTVLVGNHMGHLGLAHMKIEGTAVAFDSSPGVLKYPVAPGEKMHTGDAVFVSYTTGYVYNAPPDGPHSHVGFALADAK